MMMNRMSQRSRQSCVQAVAQAVKEGGKIVVGGNVLNRAGNFVEPTIVLSKHDASSESCIDCCIETDAQV